jgi:subtilisin family serine protease
LIGIVVTVSLVLMTPAGAQTDPAADPTISVSDTLEPEGRITSAKAPSSALAQTDPALLERSDAEPIQVAIKLDYDAVAVYTGGIPGLEPTSPSVTGVPLSERPAAAVEYEDHVAAREQAFVDALTDVVPSAEVGTSLRTVYGGISAIIPANEVENVLAIPGAVAVQLNDLRQPLTDSSPEFVNATALYAALGTTANAGEGLILGNLDTGVWPEHPSFADQGNLPPPGGPARACNFGDNPMTPEDDVFQCQNKLIGGDVFLDNYFAVPRPPETFPDTARDSNGHGTHTTSTSAGNVLENAEVFGVDRGPLHGVAPGAHVIEYKVCGVRGCNAFDSAAAVQQAILDGVDVINFSISGGTNPFTDPVELAFLDAYAAGVFVSASAGNDGPGAGTVNHLSPWTTTVAASTQTREFATTLSLTADNGDIFAVDGASVTAGAGPVPVVLAQNVAGYGDPLCGTPPPNPTIFDGLIVACQRGTVARIWKSFVVNQGGGEGMVLYNPALADVETDSHWVPTIHLPDGTAFVAFMSGHTGVTGSFPAGEARDGQGDVMAAFSSRGPAGLFIKPDVTAPGVQILAGASPAPDAPNPTEGGNPPGELFQAIAGTSMSSPHVAGAGLLLRAAHPEWTPGQIKSALMTTAITDVVKEDLATPADPFDFGAGRIDIGAANAAPVTFSETAENFFTMGNDPVNAVHLNIPSINAPVVPGRLVTTRVASNTTSGPQQFDVVTEAPEGSTITVRPNRLNVPPGQSREIEITIESDAPIGAQQFGSISLVSRGGGETLHMPVAFIHTPGEVTLTQGCDPDEIARGENTTCTVEAVNNSFDEQTVSLDTSLDAGLRIVDVEGADRAGARRAQLHDMILAGAVPGVPSVADGATPPGGFLDLAEFGIPAVPIGDEEIIQFDTPPFEYNGEMFTTLGVVSNGYLVAGETSSEDLECCVLPEGPDPARPNNMLAPLWTDLDGTDAPGIQIAVLSDGVDGWIVAQWNVEVFGTEQAEVFQIWIGLSTDANPGQDISWAYGPGSPTDPLLDFLVGAENVLGAGEMAAALPTGPQVVTSTDPVPGDAASYTLEITGTRAGEADVVTEMTASLVPGVTVARSTINVLSN